MENKIEKEAMFKITYGLFVLSAKDGEKDNGCIVNTVSMITETPKRLRYTSINSIIRSR